MDPKIRVLFVCVHNSSRSQMAEAFLKSMGQGRFIVESAGLEPRPVNPRVIEVMAESGHDLAGQGPDSVFDFFNQGRQYDYVITVCNGNNEQQCPLFAGSARRLHWPFPDPARLMGSREEVLSQLRPIRDSIRSKIEAWLSELRKRGQ